MLRSAALVLGVAASLLFTGCSRDTEEAEVRMTPEEAVHVLTEEPFCPVKGSFCYLLTDADAAAEQLGITWQARDEYTRFAEKNGLYFMTGGSEYIDRLAIFDQSVKAEDRDAAEALVTIGMMKADLQGVAFRMPPMESMEAFFVFYGGPKQY